MQQSEETSWTEPAAKAEPKPTDWKEVANKFLASVEPAETITKSVGKSINDFASNLVEEDCREFYKTLANDKRMEKFLPQIAIAALRGEDDETDGSKSALADRIDTNSNNEITQAELLAAAKSQNFNPLTQKALSFAFGRFDTLRKLDPKDSTFAYLVSCNSSNITKSDLQHASQMIDDLKGSALRIAFANSFIHNFEKIDQNKTGKITYKETANWLSDLFKQRYKEKHNVDFPANQTIMLPDPLGDVMPKATGSNGSEELTKQNLQQKIKDENQRQADFKKLWGLK